MHGVYLFKAGCCCLPVLIGCARAFLFVRAFAVQGCPVCNVIPSRKQRKVWHFSFFVSPVVITDGDMARAATSCGVVRSACGAAPNRQASSDAEAESAHPTATGGGVVASGKWQVATHRRVPPGFGAAVVGSTGEHARAIEATCGAEDAGATDVTDPTPSPPPHLRAACCPAPSPITAG